MRGLPAIADTNALFLDFDGTLVEIAARPDAIVVPPHLPDVLDALHDRLGGALALISGRGIADLRRYLPRFPGTIVGGHGAEIDPAELSGLLPRNDALPIAEVQRALIDKAAEDPAWLYEPKTHGGVLHYRTNPTLADAAHTFAAALAEAHPGLEVQPAKMAVELRPAGVGKDIALSALMTLSPFKGRVPIFAGDDVTDEAAIAAAETAGGFGIKIGAGDTRARYRVGSPADLAAWLSAPIL